VDDSARDARVYYMDTGDNSADRELLVTLLEEVWCHNDAIMSQK
jgi:hypothetical protein